MSDERYGWWLLECGHYGHDSDEENGRSTIRCSVCPEVKKPNGNSGYWGRPDRRRVSAVSP